MSDCYVIAQSRQADCALKFLNHFLPKREPAFDPSDPVDVLGIARGFSERGLLEFLERNRERAYSMYFRNLDTGVPYCAILAYLSDGALIFGLSGDQDEQGAKEMLVSLERFAGSAGYWSFEEPPAESMEEFNCRASRRSP